MNTVVRFLTSMFGKETVGEGDRADIHKSIPSQKNDKSSDLNSKLNKTPGTRDEPVFGSRLKRNSSHRYPARDSVNIDKAYLTMIQSGDVNLMRFAKAMAGMQSFAIKTHYSFKGILHKQEIQESLNNQFRQDVTESYFNKAAGQ